MGYRVKPFTMSVRNNSTQEFIDVGLLGSDVDANVEALNLKTPWVTPEMFGAKGDGVTDDTLALQRAIDNSSVVILANKSYLVTPTRMIGADGVSYALSLKSNFKIKGINASIITGSNQVTGRIMKSLRADELNNVVIDGIKFIGHASNATDDESGLVAMEHVCATNFEIKNCTFTGFNKNIECTLCDHFDIHDNNILDGIETLSKINGYGILFEQTANSIIRDNYIHVDRHCLYINECDGISAISNHLIGQNTDDSSFSHFEGNIKIDGSKDVTVSNNLIEYNYYGIAIINGFSNDRLFGLIHGNISNNIIKNCIGNSGNAWGSITLYSGTCEDVNISENKIYIDDQTINPAYRGIQVTNNDNSPVTTKNVNIVGNIVNGFEHGIRIEAVSGTGDMLSDNIVTDCATPYVIQGTDHNFGGNYNYYELSTNPPGVDLNGLRYSSMLGFKPINKTIGTELTSTTVNPFSDVLFYSTASRSIASIPGGCEGQRIILRSLANGGITITKGSMANVTVKTTFTGAIGDFIELVCMNSTWYEISRYQAS